MHRAFTSIALLILACACSSAPQVDPSQTQAIYEDAHALLEQYPSRTDIGAAAWPESLRALQPQAVRSSEEGLYIVTSSRWVEETGVFVPRNRDSFAPSPETDPEYRLISNAVFVYRVRG